MSLKDGYCKEALNGPGPSLPSLPSLPSRGEIDPVCGMTVDPARAAAVLDDGGKKVYFCSVGCSEKWRRARSGAPAPAPAEGTFWIDPVAGRVLRTALRLKAPGGSVEILVTYRPNEKLGDLWVPAEMREVSTTSDWKLECVGQYSNFRRFQVTTDVQIPK